jgi:cyanophycinase-like exopeptidase
MTQAGPLRWRTGDGWLIVAGGGQRHGDVSGEIAAAALIWADLDRPMAVLPTAGGSSHGAELLLESYADLGGPEGYVVPIYDAADAQLRENCGYLVQAGLIYIADGPDALRLTRALRSSPALDALQAAFDAGAVIVAEGAGALTVGAWLPSQSDGARVEPGLGLLENVIVYPHFVPGSSSRSLQASLKECQTGLGLGLPDQTALALGPLGEVKSLGEEQVTVVVASDDVVGG